jgi:hypothetical protein
MPVGRVCLFAGFFGGWLLTSLIRKAESGRVLRIGQDATATTVAVGDTGVTINNNPQVRLRLTVQPADGSPAYQAELRITVSRLAIPRPPGTCSARGDHRLPPARTSRAGSPAPRRALIYPCRKDSMPAAMPTGRPADARGPCSRPQ